ncbi:ABC transporter permease [Streptacidiphilus jiangxiensis]|uniref:Putative ABC transport system permease protein n=1 Tax=Streptacidiphilus jiangxiensis TaxID=235985 RepID=A0A1H7GAG6_STRJI|nr:FtsX-like permease family protein [Streptacidiphilus jiangxiensis]SEK32805.1 putative ABC transport system permease protein [Streptacidiphilus jiangxiensis]
MSALRTVMGAGVRRRRVQTVVTGLASMMAVTASVLGGSLLVASNAPFDHAFAQQNGAHLAAQFDSAKATAAELDASAHASGVTASAGPFATVTASPGSVVGLTLPAGMSIDPMKLVGRANAGGPVDDVSLTAGHWLSGPGQIVVSADYSGPEISVGQKVDFPNASGGTTELQVVGVARSVSRTADGWVEPGDVSGLASAKGADTGWQMLYRFSSASTAAQLAADRSAVAASLPSGAISGTRSWLDVKNSDDSSTGIFIPFLTAFGLLGVLMSVLIVGNVVAGAVGSGTRRIGILKAIGFTPGQVVRAYMGQALIPAAIGTLIGAVLGNLVAAQILAATEQVYGTTSLTVAPSVDLAVVAGVLLMVSATALVTALRAGRLRTVDALAVGRTPRSGRGRRAARVARALPLPRAVTLGLAQPFARPARAIAMVTAILFGAAAVTFAFGLGTSLQRIQDSKASTADVTVLTSAPPGAGSGPGAAPGGAQVGGTAGGSVSASTTPGSVDTGAMTRAIQAQSGTRAWFGTAQTQVTAAGTTGSVQVTAFVGDASWAGYQMVSGSWFTRPGEAVAPTPFLTATGTKVGDTVQLTDHGKAITVKITGEVFVTKNQGMALLTDARTLASAEPNLHAEYFSIKLAPGTDRNAYTNALNTALKPTGAIAQVGDGGGASQLLIMLDALTGLLTLVLVLVAGLGVLNTVVLDTRERVHDLGVVKALGMTPRQTVAMVIASITVVGLVGGAVGVPLGVALQRIVVPAMGNSAGLRLPASVLDVYQAPALILLGIGGLLIAVLSALLPAGWAARTRTAVALRTE